MKKIIFFSLIGLACLGLTACGCEHEFDAGKITTEATCTAEGVTTYTCVKCEKTKTESIPKIAHDYDKKVTKDATFTEEGIVTYTCADCGDSYDEVIPVKEERVIVTVTSTKQLPENTDVWRFSNYVELVFSLENETDKDIRGVQGYLEVKDIFGETFKKIGCDFTGKTLPAHGSIIVDDLSYKVNEFIDEDMKFYNTAYEDLQFEYITTCIVYADGTKEEF